MDYDLTYLSLGAGVQSSALYVMSVLGLRDCPKADVAIFADTQDEPRYVYDHLDLLKKWGGERIPIKRVTRGCLSADIIRRIKTGQRSAMIPAWTIGDDGKESPLWRQCTQDYKTAVIQKEARRLLGYESRQRIKKRCCALIGISLDEADRVAESREHWIVNIYPLIDARMRWQHCVDLLKEHGFGRPGKSACVQCPYHGDAYWRELKAKHREEFDRAVEIDEAIRDMSRVGVKSPVYLHRSLRPLATIDFKDRQMDFFANECSGVCGV